MDINVNLRTSALPIVAEATIAGRDWCDYRFTLTFGDGLELVGLDIQRTSGAALINAWRLQHVPIGALECAARAQINLAALTWDDLSMFHPDDWLYANERPRGNSNERKHAELAKAYVETLGDPHQVQTLAKRTGYAAGSIPALIRRARQRHLLTLTSKGSPGGQLTPRALAILGDDRFVVSDAQRCR